MNKQNNNAIDNSELMFAIFDNVSYRYERPFIEANKQTAVRLIQDMMMSNPNSPHSKFPEDFSLCHIGYYDASDGSVLDIESTTVQPLEEIHKRITKE